MLQSPGQFETTSGRGMSLVSQTRVRRRNSEELQGEGVEPYGLEYHFFPASIAKCV